MEACGGSHFMARKLTELGHIPKLISPQFVRPFVKTNKNDFVDAEAICEAAFRSSMRFVQPRSESQQAMRALHRVRESLVQDKVKTTNQIHAFLLEFGISVTRGAAVISRLSTILENIDLPQYLSQLLLKLQQHYHYLVEQIKDLESQLKRKLDEDEVGKRLLSIPCVGTLRGKRKVIAILLRWLNPDPQWASKEALYRNARYHDDEPGMLLLLNDFSESLWFTRPRSDAQQGVWWFDNVAHKAVPVARLRNPPTTGHLTGEIRRGDHLKAIMDLLPEGTVIALTLVVQPQDKLEEYFSRLSRDSMGENVDSIRAKEDTATARSFLEKKHKLYRALMTFLIKAHDQEILNKRYLDLSSILLNNGLEPVNPEHDIAPLSGYLRAMLMCFNPQLERHNWYTSLMFAQHFACLVPVYGRDTGTGNPGLTFFNRGGGPLSFDPLSKADRTQNAHKLLFGPTGAGKSATALAELAQMMAVYRPRIFLIEAGNSSGLFGEHCSRDLD